MNERIAPKCGCPTVGKIVRGMCKTHYDRWIQSTPKDKRPTPPRFDRKFWDYVDKSSSDRGCWLWTGPTDAKGYGFWSNRGERGLAHRLSLGMSTPCPDKALFACHHCDNPPCVNPSHLYWGTVQDNVNDMIARRGAHNKGKHKSSCPSGHPMSGGNLAIYSGYRFCRTCMNNRSREYQRRRRAEARGAA